MNRADQKCPDTDQLEIATKVMRLVDVSEVPEEVIRLTGQAMTRSSHQRRWRTYALQGAAAAVIVLVLLALAGVIAQTSSSLALADVSRKVEATKTLRAIVVDPGGGGTLFVSGTRRRLDGEGTVVIADSATGQQVILDTKSKSGYHLPRQVMTSALLDFYGIFRQLGAATSTPIKEYVDKAGRRFPGFSGKTALEIGGTIWKVEAKVWSDPKTTLPVRLEIRPTEGGEWALLIEQIEFDVPLDDAIFAMTIPEEYTVMGLSADQLKPLPSEQKAAKLTIVPTVGIGEVKFGMSREQIVAVLGEPEFTMHGAYLGYPSKGLQLVLVGREPDKLGMIIANPMDAHSLTRNEFRGQTDKGIRMGSTFQEVRDAYGEPNPALPDDNSISGSRRIARYRELGIMFSFVDGKLRQIITSRTD